jgi:RNA polymerase sigma factor (sigma-70 family)
MSIPEPTDPDDATLVARCRAGDGLAWGVLVQRYQRLVYAIARRAGLDEQLAADVFQTVFLRLLQQLPRIAEPARLQAWIVTTAKREAWLQRQRGERLVSMTVTDPDGADEETWAAADSAPGPEETVAHWEQLARVQRGLDRLDTRCRQLLRALFDDQNIGYDDVAAHLGMPIGSIGPTRARCLARLRRLVD